MVKIYKINFSLIFLGILMIGCNNTSKQKPDIRDNIKSEVVSTPVTPVLHGDSAIVYIPLEDGKGNMFIHKKADQTIYVRFESKSYQKVHASLSSPESTANIRFSQIFLPDGTMDGPFGRELTYDLPTEGSYQISIHENMMAGNPWEGNFNIQIELQ